jgi:hypothetical protein
MPKFSNPKPARPSSITYDVGVYDDHTEVFCLNELIHREDGPAITKRAPELTPKRVTTRLLRNFTILRENR